MSELIIIAGPQAAGKSTVISNLVEQYRSVAPLFGKAKRPLIFPLQESRQIIVHTHMLLGAIFMNTKHEREVVQCDFRRMRTISGREDGRLVYLDECNIFTIAHAKAHGISDIESFWNQYITHLQKLNAKVIFLDIPSGVSWERRRRKYEERLIYFPKRDHARLMQAYENYLTRVQPLLHEVFDQLPLPKKMIDASQSSKDVLLEVSHSLVALSKTFH